MRQRGLPPVQRQTEYFPFQGGLDLVTPPIAIKNGVVRDALNFECNINGGYTRIQGYERFDGQASPSDASYTILEASITGAWAAGNTLTGLTSGATGVITTAVTSGATTYFVLTKIVGTFQDAESLQISAVTVATATAGPITLGATTAELDAIYRNQAADQYRTDILAVPGTGDILGVKAYNDVVYAFRANAGNTAVDMYKDTAGGWVQVPLGRELAFTSGGTYQPQDGDTITGATSGATAVVTRVVLSSGSWAAGTAAGRFVFASQTGTFQAENLNVGANLNVATIAGNASAITLATGGRFEFKNHNFGGLANVKRMYGCDGVNRAFEFDSDGEVFAPIATGMSQDSPSYLVVHKQQLMLAFAGSLQHSGPGTPYAFSLVLGAAEIALGDTITGMQSQPGDETGGALLIATRNSLKVLYGSGVSDWNLVEYAQEAGAFAYSMQQISMSVMLDDRGLAGLATTANFGNFEQATISRLIKPWLNARKTRLLASSICREKNQYRLYFSDKSALYVTIIGKKVMGMMPVYFEDTVRCICSAEFSDGSEKMFFGSSDGFVYQLDMGTSFDGDDIEYHFYLSFNHSKSPRTLKRYREAVFEVSGDGYAEFSINYDLGYQSEDIEPSREQLGSSAFSSRTWDSGNWDIGYWDGRTLSPSAFDLTGSAENISLKVAGRGDYFDAVTFNGVMLDYSMRRNLR